jgi:penicillin-binding protein 2
MSRRTIHERVIEGIAERPTRTSRSRSTSRARPYNYLFERREQFPGVQPRACTCASTRTTSSPPSCSAPRARSPRRSSRPTATAASSRGTRIGKDGIEETYDEYLRGTPGYDRIVINALGERDDTRRITAREPRQGNRVRLTLDLEPAAAAHNALKRAIAAAAQRRARPAATSR